MSLLNMLTSSFIRRNCSVFDIKYDGGYPNPGYHFLQSQKPKILKKRRRIKMKDENQPNTSKGRAVKQTNE